MYSWIFFEHPTMSKALGIYTNTCFLYCQSSQSGEMPSCKHKCQALFKDNIIGMITPIYGHPPLCTFVFPDIVFAWEIVSEAFIIGFRPWINQEAIINHFSNFQIDFTKDFINIQAELIYIFKKLIFLLQRWLRKRQRQGERH